MRLFTWRSFIVCLLLLPGAVLNAQNSKPSGYHLLQKIALGGEGGWDLLTVDHQAHRLYISRSTHVMVVDINSGKVVGDIPDTKGVHGIAVAPEIGKGYTSNGRDNTVTIFDLQTLKVLSQVPVGKNPDVIIYDADSKRIFTFNGGSNDATAIDVKTGAVVGTVALGGRPELAAADEQGHIFVNLEDKSEVVKFDSRKLNVEAHWPLAPGEEPTGIALDRKHSRLFIACANKLMAVMDTGNGKVLTTLPIGDGVDGAEFDPETGLAFSPNGRDGTLTVIHEDSPEKFSIRETVATQKGARTMTLDSKTHQVFLVTADFGPPPAATAERPRPRPSIIPGSFVLLVMGR